MTQTVSMISRLSNAAMLAMAVLPMVALASAADAASVKVSDINAMSAQGVATFEQRVDAASNKYCADQRGLTALKVCRDGVKVELTEKFDALRTAQAQSSKSFAAR